MTGYGRGDAEGWTTEIRSVNHRFGDVVLRVPPSLAPLENRFKEEIKKRVKRGRVEVRCTEGKTIKSKALSLSLDEELADRVYELLKRLNERYGFGRDIDLSLLANFREIFRPSEESPDLESLWASVLPSLKGALESLDGARQHEGEQLFQGLTGSLRAVEAFHLKFTERAPFVIETYRDKLEKRLQALLPEDSLDPGRLLQEVALFADRSDITEELARLLSHVRQFDAAVEGRGPHGRRLEFLLQEMNREINTIGSKANDLELSQWVVESKCELEKMREQTQNVE